MNLDPTFVSVYDPTIRARVSAFGFETPRSHSFNRKRDIYGDTALKIASYVPVFGLFAAVLLTDEKSSTQRAYDQIKKRMLIKKIIVSERILHIENIEQIPELDAKLQSLSLSTLSIVFDRYVGINSSWRNEVKQFIGLSPLDPFTSETMKERKAFWEGKGEEKKIEACDKLIALLEEYGRIKEEEGPKLAFLKSHYLGIKDPARNEEDLILGYITRSVLSLLGIGLIVLPIFDVSATIYHEYKARARIQRAFSIIPSS